MKTLIRRITIAVPIILAVFFMTSCDPENFEFDDFENGGWWGIENEDTESIEDAIQFGSGNLPSSADISNRFPPVGNQGQYGTCVTWAVGYNHKSYMEAVANDRTTSDLNNEAYQFSPKYLFWAIPSGSKGADCGGTGFEPAYDVMLNQGIAQMSVTPYTDLGDCSGSTSQWDGEAAQYSIESYREIGTDASSLKQYIANGQVVSFGAKLGDNFMSWNSSDVHYSDTYDYSGPHAYHAMTISGYDDSKGINGAFRVRNSWGTGWGDNGDIWVDENFFTGGDFAFCAFIATNSATTDPDPDGDNEVNDQEEGKDLLGWELNDVDNPNSSDPTDRVAKYNVFNSGNETIYASEDWNIIYIYYNAYDANDYGILLYDYYSDDYGSLGEDGELTDGGDGLQNWWNNINVPAGHSVA
ncbi:MAG: C1 family peptidase, partial [Bacteroidota bacterium]|nr:C1 family peptidase [Bacteroidota bacterium]